MRDVCEKIHAVLVLEVLSVKFSWDPGVFLHFLALLPLNKNVSGARNFHSFQKMV